MDSTHHNPTKAETGEEAGGGKYPVEGLQKLFSSAPGAGAMRSVWGSIRKDHNSPRVESPEPTSYSLSPHPFPIFPPLPLSSQIPPYPKLSNSLELLDSLCIGIKLASKGLPFLQTGKFAACLFCRSPTPAWELSSLHLRAVAVPSFGEELASSESPLPQSLRR